VLVVEFQREAWVHGHSAESLRDDLQAHAVLRSGSELSVQLLAVYANPQNTFANMQAALALKQEAKILWDLFFGDDWVSVPVPVGAEEPYVPLSARLVDLCGKFPVGAIEVDPQTATARLKAFQDYIEDLKEYLGSRGNPFLDDLDPDDFAQAVSDYLKAAPDPKAPLRDLSDLLTIDGVTPQVLNALVPYLDTRTDWKFSVNGLTVPMIMTITGKTVEEAQEVRGNIQETPLDNAAQIASSPLGQRDVTLYPNPSLLAKSEAFEIYLEADVRGVLRTAWMVYRKDAKSGKFRSASWVEGRVPGWPSRGEPEPKPEASPSPSPGPGAAGSGEES
jgi:hypothetical protein